MGGACEVAYSAAKGAVIAFSKALAKEVAPSGITVNSVAPGVIDTDMMGFASQETRDLLAEETPMGRLGQPADVAETIYFLASPAAAFLTGQVLAPNGLASSSDRCRCGRRRKKPCSKGMALFPVVSLSPRICPLPPKSAGWVPARAAGTTSC